MTSPMDCRRRGTARFQVVRLGFVALIVTAVAAGLSCGGRQPLQTGAIPDEVAGYRLLRSIEGQEALQVVAEMHQEAFQLDEAWVAFYERGGIVSAGTAASLEVAREQVEAMARAIGKGGTPFSNLREINVAGRRVFTVTVTHSSTTDYFFQSGDQVIWITPPRDSGQLFVEAVLRKLQA